MSIDFDLIPTERVRMQADLATVTADFRQYKDYIATPAPTAVTLKAEETGLIIVDMQEGWCDATIAKARGAEWMYDSQIIPVIANIKELLTTARSMGMPIIHVRWNDPPGAVPHPIYWELAPEAGELVLLKGGPGVFTGPLSASAIKYFTDYMVNYPKVKQFIVTGTVVNWCVLNTAIGIRWINATGPDRAGYSIVFAVDAVSGNAFLHSPTTPNPVVDYAYWWLYFADGGGAFGPSTSKLTKTDQITFT